MVLTIIQWILAGIFGILTLSNGFSVGSLFFLLLTILLLPIKKLRLFIKIKLKIKKAIAVVLAFVLFIAGVACSPTATPTSEIGNSSYNKSVIISSDIVLNSAKNPASDSFISSNFSSTKVSSSNKTASTSSSKPITLSSIPSYSGNPYVVLNNNIPNFSSQELKTTAFEKYSSLDSLGRCGVAFACCGTEIMPKENEERGSISSIYPSGWVQAKYDNVSGKYLYNRSHLIGWQLSAENANSRNLITGTRYFNTKGMLPFENMVADYIKETKNHVLYRITPIYSGNNLLANGVQMEAFSVEDNGDGICFNVFCYNVQPGIKINYKTGASSKDNSATASTSVSSANSSKSSVSKVVSTSSSNTYILNISTKKFHKTDCGSAKKISAKNYDETTKNRQTLINEGYSPCGNCKP